MLGEQDTKGPASNGDHRDADAALQLLIGRIRSTAGQITEGLPHWADPSTGRWVTTPDGDWTGGAWVGMLWCAARLTGSALFREAALNG